MTITDALKQIAKMRPADRAYSTVAVPLPLLLKLIDGVRPEQSIIDAREKLK